MAATRRRGGRGLPLALADAYAKTTRISTTLEIHTGTDEQAAAMCSPSYRDWKLAVRIVTPASRAMV